MSDQKAEDEKAAEEYAAQHAGDPCVRHAIKIHYLAGIARERARVTNLLLKEFTKPLLVAGADA